MTEAITPAEARPKRDFWSKLAFASIFFPLLDIIVVSIMGIDGLGIVFLAHVITFITLAVLLIRALLGKLKNGPSKRVILVGMLTNGLVPIMLIMFPPLSH